MRKMRVGFVAKAPQNYTIEWFSISWSSQNFALLFRYSTFNEGEDLYKALRLSATLKLEFMQKLFDEMDEKCIGI